MLVLAALVLAAGWSGSAWAVEVSPAASQGNPQQSEYQEPTILKPVGQMIRWFGSGFSLHRQNYLLPVTWGNEAKESGDAEVKFQLSFRQQLSRTHLYFAYTQKSFWRVWDKADSRPFRETNHNPELFYRFETARFPFTFLWLDVGFEHESNGAREPLSRSWNRFTVTPHVEFNRFAAALKLWYRIPEEEKRFPDDPGGDENPDIVDFYGHGELSLGYQFANGQMLNVMGRYNFDSDKGGLQADYSVPVTGVNAFLVAQIWTGYGESLIDYDRDLTRYGVGVMFRR